MHNQTLSPKHIYRSLTLSLITRSHCVGPLLAWEKTDVAEKLKEEAGV